MFEILTPLDKVDRVSRKIDADTFVITAGMWAYLADDESLVNIATGTNKPVNKLVMTTVSSNDYESHDVMVGRVTTVESYGIRCKLDSTLYTGTPVLGDYMVVSSASGTEGKLVPIRVSAIGTYEVVAKVEEVNNTDGFIVVRTLSATMDSNDVSASASISPSGSRSPSGSGSPSASTSPSGSTSQSASISPSSSNSRSTSPSASTSPSGSVSPSASASV
jgi:hypothetical protein